MHRDREENGSCQRMGDRATEVRLMLNGYRASVWENEKFWRSMKMMSANKCDCTYCYKNYTLKGFPWWSSC